jgi:tetratricopeptide (TPR) repeat protein
MLFTFLFVLVFSLKGQGSTNGIVDNNQNNSKLRAIQVVGNTTFKLNSVNYSTFWDGINKRCFKIELPPNTVEWYYSFTASKNNRTNVNLNLFGQVANLISADPLTIATNAIKVMSEGTDFCYVYLTDETNGKRVNRGGEINWYHPDYSRKKVKDGIVNVRNFDQDNMYLCFDNENTVNAITITFEVVAIIEENRDENNQKASTFGGLGWNAYEKGDYDKCLELSKKALEYNSELGYVHNNIGLVYLIKKDYISAIESYSTAITLFKRDKNPKYWFNEAIKDLNNLIKTHGKIEGSSEILDLLQKESSRY